MTAELTLKKQVESLLGLISPRVGLIRTLTRVSRGAEEPSPPIFYQATISHFDFRKGTMLERGTCGKGVTDSEAMGGAIGEAVERYCGAQPDVRVFRRASWAALGTDAVAPPECVLYSEAQYARDDFPYPRWNDQTETAWFPARELPGGKDVLAPASLIFTNYPVDRSEDYICPPTTNGLAAGPDLESATRSALYELVERDGFLICWMNKLPVPEVNFSGMGGVAGSIRAHYERFGLETRVFNLTTDLPVYVMMGISLDRSGKGPAAVVGLGGHPDPRIALIKALYEVCQVRPGEARKFAQNPPAKRLQSYEDIRTLEDHSAFFTTLDRLNELEFLLGNGRTQQIEDLPNHSVGSVQDDLDNCVKALTRAGSRVICADVTTPDLEGINIRVVRAIATGLQPMHFGHGEERLGGRRLYELPVTLGYARTVRSEGDLNPCPHPLA